MKSKVAFVDRFRKSLDRIPRHVRDRINRRGGLSEERLLELILQPEDYRIKSPEAPSLGAVLQEFNEEECDSLGKAALSSGSVAYCVLAGGAGTRIGEPKALLKIPDSDDTLLSVKLRSAAGIGPIWVVTNPSLFDQVSEHVFGLRDVDTSRVKILQQYESYRLTPDNQVKFSGDAPDLYPCGHGDVFSALTESDLLASFSSSGRCVQVVNVDNLVSSLDSISVGRHISSGGRVSFEVVNRLAGDSGGFLCDIFGSRQIVEGFRIAYADLDIFEWLSTNTFTFDASIDVRPIGKNWHRIQKNVCGELLIQHERLSQEITEAYDTIYLSVDRIKRFYPIKNAQQLLDAKRQTNE